MALVKLDPEIRARLEQDVVSMRELLAQFKEAEAGGLNTGHEIQGMERAIKKAETLLSVF